MLIDPTDLACSEGVWKRSLRSTDFNRLSVILSDADVAIEVCLRFSLDANKRVLVEGHANFSPTVECQRCLERVLIPVQCTFNICVTRSGEEADEVMAFADPVVLSGNSMTVQELIEDDLILSLPRVACSDQVQCPRDPMLTDRCERETKENPLAEILKIKENLRFS